MTYTAARCIAESDGYHLHEYDSGPLTIVEHLHSWNEEHQRNWPDASFLDIRRGQKEQPYGGTLAEAWAEISDQPMPAAKCEVES